MDYFQGTRSHLQKLKTLKFEIIMQNPNFPSIVNVKNIRDEKCA